MSQFEEIDFNQDPVFTGPVTQEELIITWRKRRQERLEREKAEAEAQKSEAAKCEKQYMNDTSASGENGESEGMADRIESDRISEPDSVTTSAEKQVIESVQPVQPPPKPSSNILRPARLNVDSASFTTDWAERINMKKLDKPKRPDYVQPLE